MQKIFLLWSFPGNASSSFRQKNLRGKEWYSEAKKMQWREVYCLEEAAEKKFWVITVSPVLQPHNSRRNVLETLPPTGYNQSPNDIHTWKGSERRISACRSLLTRSFWKIGFTVFGMTTGIRLKAKLWCQNLHGSKGHISEFRYQRSTCNMSEEGQSTTW